jgi:uncharacterized membrane protein YdjX (TVP38/TMEM64 family)
MEKSIKDIRKTGFLIVTIGAILLVAGGLALVPRLRLTGFIFAGASVILYIGFLVALKKGKEPLIRLAIAVYIFGVFIVVVMIVLAYTGVIGFFKDMSEGELQEYIAKSSAPKLLFVALQFLQVTFIPIPSTISTVAGVFLWGWESVIWTLAGVLPGSLLAFGLGRWLGDKVVRWIVGQETLDKYYGYVKGKDKTLLFLMFLLPVFPDDALCIMAGLTNMKVRTFILMMLISRPIQALSTAFATIVLKNIDIPDNLRVIFWIVVVIVALLLIFFVLKNSAKIEQKLLAYSDRLRKKKDKIVAKIKKTAFYQRHSRIAARAKERFENGKFYQKHLANRIKKRGASEKEIVENTENIENKTVENTENK